MHVAVILALLLNASSDTAHCAPTAPRAACRTKASNGWLGVEVVTKGAKRLRLGDHDVDDGSVFRVYRVTDVKDGWLGLCASGVKGWVLADDVARYDEALYYFTKVIAKDCTAAWAYNARGLLRKYAADSRAAEPKPPEATASVQGSAATPTAQRLYDLAIRDFDAAIALEPDWALPYNNRGAAQLARDRKSIDSAMDDFNHAIRIDPQCGVAYNNRGVAWYAKKEYPQALTDLRRAKCLRPSDPIPSRNVASAIFAGVNPYYND